MIISRIFYLLNILFAINLLKPCFCFINKKIYKDINEVHNIDAPIEKKNNKKKKILISCGVAATFLLAAGLLGGGLYLTRDKRKSLWDNDKLGNDALDIIFSSILEGVNDINKIPSKEKKDLSKIITRGYIKNMMKEQINNNEVMFSETQKRELYSFVPQIQYVVKSILESQMPTYDIRKIPPGNHILFDH
ncbi:early transcribed membrane protein [Plasmodium relictum]|uniref:Early transcribed membrane protein n=1 Tax=Plasmodium relictum TaxID=85471 RepID=A0A1J1GKJ6_PLARL|nr:early transcribed membrane protein [Plasmodium relictum]CRG85485.1 early transcribed membrane protein [Plasmodium relictum]